MEERIKYLMTQYVDKKITPKEREELDGMMNEIPKIDTSKNLEKTMALIHAKQRKKRWFWRLLGFK